MRWSYFLVAALPGWSSCGSEVSAAGPPSAPPPVVVRGESDLASDGPQPSPNAASTAGPTAAPTAACPGAPARVLADARDLEVLTSIAVDGEALAFGGGSHVQVPPEAPPGSDTAGVVRRISLASGQTRELWRGQGIVYRVASAAGTVSFVSYDYASRGRTGRVHRLAPGDGGADQVLATWRSQGASMGLAAADRDLYWSHSAGSGGMVLATSETGTTTELASAGIGRGLMAVNPSTVFWLQDGIQGVARTGGPAVTVWQGDQAPSALGLDPSDERLFFAAGNTLHALQLADGSTTTLATGQPTIVDLVADGRAVYAATGDDGKVIAFPIDGGPPTTLVSGQTSVDQLALDRCNVFWLNSVDRTIAAAGRSN